MGFIELTGFNVGVIFWNGNPLCFAVLGFVSACEKSRFANGFFTQIFGISLCKLRALSVVANWVVGFNVWESDVFNRSW